MKNISRTLALLLVAVLVFMMVPVTYAAEIEAEPGQTLTVSFSFSQAYTVNGQFSYSNKGLFSSVSYDTSSSGLAGNVTNEYLYIYSLSEEATSGAVKVVVKVSPDAKPGDRCDITLRYETGDIARNMSDPKTTTHTVVIKAPATEPTEPQPTEPQPTTPTEPKPTQPTTPTKPKPTQPTTPTKPKPTDPSETEPEIDYTELLRQIGIGESLNEPEYTKDSWAPLADALEKGRELLDSDSQAAVDAGAAAIAEAIRNLVKLDFGGLDSAVEAANQMQESNTLGQICNRLHDALARAKELKQNGGTQEEIDALAAEIAKILEEAQAALAELTKEPETVEVIKEVTKEVEPSGPYCNIPMHKVWPILFFISLGLNLLLLLLLLLALRKKKKDQKDDTPMVDYDPNDD